MDSLSQGQPAPVLILPAPDPARLPEGGCRRVLAITDHLTGDDALVSWAVTFAPPNSQLYLAHVQDDVVLERFLSVVERIRELDTDDARKLIPEKLLNQPPGLHSVHQPRPCRAGHS